jgi:hypothetical protein
VSIAVEGPVVGPTFVTEATPVLHKPPVATTVMPVAVADWVPLIPRGVRGTGEVTSPPNKRRSRVPNTGPLPKPDVKMSVDSEHALHAI